MTHGSSVRLVELRVVKKLFNLNVLTPFTNCSKHISKFKACLKVVMTYYNIFIMLLKSVGYINSPKSLAHLRASVQFDFKTCLSYPSKISVEVYKKSISKVCRSRSRA